MIGLASKNGIAFENSRQNLVEIIGPKKSRIKFVSPDEITQNGGSFDYVKAIIRGELRDAITLVDHAVIEHRYAAMLDMLHRFDK